MVVHVEGTVAVIVRKFWRRYQEIPAALEGNQPLAQGPGVVAIGYEMS